MVSLALPPLRERGEDIVLLAKTFLQRYTAEHGKRNTGLSQHVIRALQDHAWPGNVRELENRIKRAVIMAEGRKLTPADLELGGDYAKYEGMALREARELLEKELVQKALAKHKGNITKAAADLGISRPTLYELMEKVGIKKRS